MENAPLPEDEAQSLDALRLNQALAAQRAVDEKLRQTLAELEQQYRVAEHARSETRAIIDATSEAIILISPGGYILSVDKQFTEYFALRPEDVAGRRFDELHEFERIFADPAAFKALVTATARDEKSQFTEIITQFWPRARELELYSNPVQSAGGEHLGRLYVFRDVTHERAVDRMKSEFVSLVSHELRTPLTSIKGYVDLLLEGDAGALNGEQAEYLGIVKNNADRLVNLINDLLDVSRIESGNIQLQRTSLDIAQSIREVASSLKPQIEEKGQQLELNIPEALPAVSGDAGRVTQILTNLLSNAYKYTPAGGTITITASAQKSMVRVDVRDTGIGLSPEEQAQLFTRFFRARNQTTQEVGGTGLGLSITRSLVEMHGGEIIVSSAPGQGSTFSFTLPIVPGTLERKTLPLPSLVGRRILVVDDEPDIANLIRRYLKRAGYKVHIAHNAADALKLARTEHPDLITLDIMLPDTDGLTLLEWLKNDHTTAEIPVLLLSIVDEGEPGKFLGAVDYLRKPISESTLLEHVNVILAEDQAHLILVADDDADIRRLIAGNLRRAGYQVIEASNGSEAVALAQSEHPGLTLIDIRMPGMDGIAALRILRADPATRGIPAIMMTSSPIASEENRSTIEALGGVMLLHKPITIEELAHAITQAMATGGPTAELKNRI
jgi:PAS domain S-box-containing protein